MEVSTDVPLNTSSTIDSEVESCIYNLVSALGGPDATTTSYKLGDEALACLRDLRKWLQNYDAKFDRLEVACAIANTSLVTRDIPAILSQWDATMRAKGDPYLDRIALACLELLVPLTWPIEIVEKEATAEQFSQSVHLKKCQLKYKHALITYKSRNVLKSVIQLAKSALKTDIKDREERDEGVLTLVCSFFRNLVSIESEGGYDRGSVIHELQHQKVLKFLLTIMSGLGTNFDTQDTLMLETVYHIVRSIDVPQLYGVKQTDNGSTLLNHNLKAMLDVENEMNITSFKPSRHSRFGTMISMTEGRGTQITVSGQQAVAGMEQTLSHINSNKKWHKPRQREVGDELEKFSFMPGSQAINGDLEALKVVKAFTNDFLDSSFNPLLAKIRVLIDKQQSARATKKTAVIYCYLVGWFLEAERTRATILQRVMDFQLVGDALGKSSFGILLGLLRRGLEPGEYRSTDLVHAAMLGFRQVLLTIRDMSYCGNQDFVDIADGIKSRLFYEESWLNMLSQLPRTSHRKSLVYACETIALTHVVLKMLDEYAKQHTYLFVKSMRSRRKQKPSSVEDEEDGGPDVADIDLNRDQRESIRVTNERKFSFDKFVLKYIHEATITTYERVLSSFKEVSEDSIIQIFSFFRRTFGKTDNKAVFYRISLMRVLLTLVSHHGLPDGSEGKKVAGQFLRYFVNKFVKTAQRMPSLHVQVNEVMTPADAFYYDHSGQDKVRFKPPKYEFSLTDKAQKTFEPERQMAVLVAALIDSGKDVWLRWIEEQLSTIINDSKDSGGIKRQFIVTDSDKMKAIRSDALIRLLLKSLGLVVNIAQGQIVLPGNIDELVLVDKLLWLGKYQREPVEFPGGKTALDFVKIEGEPDRVEYESDDEDNDQEGYRSLLAPQPGAESSIPRSSYKSTNSSKQTKKSRRRVRPDDLTPPADLPSPSESPLFSEKLLEPALPSETHNGVSDKFKKRGFTNAFALAPSDDDSESGVTSSIAAIRRRKAIDDDDSD